MAEEGSSSAQVGALNVGVGGDITGLQSKLAQAEAATKASAARMAAVVVPIGNKSAAFGAAAGFGMGKGAGVSTIGGAAAGAGVAGVTAEFDKADNKAKGLFRSITGIRSALSRMFLPVVLFAGVNRLVEGFDKLIHSVQDFRAELDAVNAGPLAAMQASLVQLRIEQGRMTDLQAETLRLQTEQRANETAMIAKLNAKVSVLEQLASAFRGILGSTSAIAPLIAMFTVDTGKAVKESRDLLQTHIDILKSLEDQKAAAEELERVQKRMREQAKRDITHTTIDASRFGPALDLLQRQRTGT